MAEGRSQSFILGPKSVELQEEIGKGTYSRVFAASFRNSAGQVCKAAAKKVRTSSVEEREIQTMKQLSHKNIIKFYGVFICAEDESYIIMELAERKDLRCFLNNYRVEKPPPVRLPAALVRKWVFEGAFAIQYLHSLQKAHRDIKSLNFLVMSDFTLKLGDLGLAKELVHTAKTKGGGTCRWMAPEVISQQMRSPKSDVFSFGIVIWEIATTEVPFADIKGDFRVMQAVCDGKRPVIPQDCPQELAQLIQWCWDGDHTRRPTMDEICTALHSCQADAPGFSPDSVDLQVKHTMGPPSSSASSGTQEAMDLGTFGSGDVDMMTLGSREQTDSLQTGGHPTAVETAGLHTLQPISSQSSPPPSHTTIQAASYSGRSSPFTSQSSRGDSTIQAASYSGRSSPFTSQSSQGLIPGQSVSQSPTIQSQSPPSGHIGLPLHTPVQESAVPDSFQPFQQQSPPPRSSQSGVGYSSLISREDAQPGSPRLIEHILSDVFMLDLAKQLGPEWIQLGIYLGYTLHRTERFQVENHTVEDAILKLLINWRQKQDRRQGTAHVVDALSNALRRCERGDLAAIVDAQER